MLLLVDNAVQRSVLSITFACLFLLIDIFHTQSQLKKDREETKTGRKRKRERDTLKRNEIWEKSEKETGEPTVRQLSAAVLLLRRQLVSAEYLIIKQQKRCSEVKEEGGKGKRCASAEQMLTNYTTRQIEANTRAQRAAKSEKEEEVLPYKLIQVTFFPLLALPFLYLFPFCCVC